MVNKITLTGMVLSATPVAEYDKRLVILTKERGTITAFAKGARRPNSSYVAASRPLSFGEFSLYEGRTAYNLVGVNIKNYFEEIAMDIDNVYYGFYFLELSDYFSSENVDGTDVLKLLYVSLKAILNKAISNELVRRIFELKLLAINGQYPEIFSCIKCGNKSELKYYSSKLDGALCRECEKAADDAIELNTSTFYTMQYIVSARMDKLYTFTVSDQVLREFQMVLKRFMKKHIDKEFKSEELLI